jgi:hypothetical protein
MLALCTIAADQHGQPRAKSRVLYAPAAPQKNPPGVNRELLQSDEREAHAGVQLPLLLHLFGTIRNTLDNPWPTKSTI